MIAGKQDACTHNNALWCDEMLKSAGAETRFHSSFWYADGKSLPLYPNIVTLSPRPAADLDRALKALPRGSAVKDSFDTLDLSQYGYRKLFSGVWLFRPEQANRKPHLSSDWLKVTHAEGLNKWLAAWNTDEELHPLFAPELLDNKAIDFAAIQKDGELKAGAIFNAGPKLNGADVIGLSNVFCRKNWLYSALHALLEPFAHKPVCTYETDREVLPVYRQLGFEDCGPLSVWLKD
ncbi:MAG: hypothetical protein K5905_08520 [Roseibium sp.]|uniref:hypothetical protein n=1 Tax=Roseibium sp. TaxID=1936156 RepID=UPI002610E10F|nr:hypothetical protein [Roseibium sp.]MCV0425504.1 hypothetical protein [Roseibium sp.]